MNSSNRPTVLYNSWHKLTLNALVSLLNQPGVSTLKPGSTNSLLIDQEYNFETLEDARKTKHTRNVFWVAIKHSSHFST